MFSRFTVPRRLVALIIITYVALNIFVLYKWSPGGDTGDKLRTSGQIAVQMDKSPVIEITLQKRRDTITRTRRIGANVCNDTSGENKEDDDTHPLPGALLSRLVSSAMNTTEKSVAIATLEAFANMCSRHNITYWMYSGTLLGSFRHHDVILWDDDIDVIIPLSDRNRAYREMCRLSPTYRVYSAGTRLKLWSTRGSSAVRGRPWRWPYVDVSFYDSNATHVWDASSEKDLGERYYTYKISSTFPLHRRPLNRLSLSAPRDTYDHLQATYPVSLVSCWTPTYLHKTEKAVTSVCKFRCRLLRNIVPFVHRTKVLSGDGILETLIMANRVVHVRTVEEPMYAITDPYTLKLVGATAS